MASPNAFSLTLTKLQGNSFRIDHLQDTDHLDVLLRKVHEATGIHSFFLRLVLNEQKLDYSQRHQTLADLKITSCAKLTVLHGNEPLVYVRELHQNGGRGGCWNEYTCNSCERVLLDSDGRCTLVSVNAEDSSSSLCNAQYVHWDVLVGSYKVVDMVAMCTWDRHCQQVLGRGGGMFRPDKIDHGWQVAAPVASFKWRRIELPGCSPLAESRQHLADCPEDADLLLEPDFAEQLCDIDLRHFNKEWCDTSNGVQASLLQQFCTDEERQKEQQVERVSIDNDALPMAFAKLVCRWRRLSTEEAVKITATSHAGLKGFDVDADCILGVPMTQQLSDGHHPGGEYSPADKVAKSNFAELLRVLEDGDEDEKEVSFELGQYGFSEVPSTGTVLSVEDGTQAKRLGVKVGWKIILINGEPYSEEHMDAVSGTASTLMFKTVIPEAETYLWTATGIESVKSAGRYEEYGSPSTGDSVATWITAVLKERGLLQMMEDCGHMEKPADPDNLPDMFSLMSQAMAIRRMAAAEWDSNGEGKAHRGYGRDTKRTGKGTNTGSKHKGGLRWKPVFTKIEALLPDSEAVSLQVRVVSDGRPLVVGDETGVVSLRVHFKHARAVKAWKVGSSLTIRKASIKMVKRHMHLMIDQSSSLEVARDDLPFEPNFDNDVSAPEHERRFW